MTGDAFMKLVSNSAVVTGGAQGIGLGIASQLMMEGTNVLLFDREEETVRAAAEQLNRSMDGYARVVPFTGDVTRADDVTRGLEAATRELGPPGILVNNAGVATLARIVDMTEEEFDRVLDVSLKGAFLFTRAFARALIATKQPGAIVNVSSLNQFAATDGFAHYCAAKAGLGQFTQVAAAELGRYGIRVNAVAPGSTRTPALSPLLAGPMGAEFLARTPLGRMGEPDDVAKVVAFLCSDYGAWVTGDTISVDGGQHIRGLHSYWDTVIKMKQGS
jgi:3-oxoacyl-[acyl-carrier protein] reductase